MRRPVLGLILLFARAALCWEAGQELEITTARGAVVGTLVAETTNGLLIRSATGTVMLPFDTVLNVRAMVRTAPAPEVVRDSRIEAREKLEAEDAASPALRRVRFFGATSLGGGAAIGTYSLTNSRRCVPCFTQDASASFNASVSLGIAVPLGALFWLRLAGTFDWAFFNYEVTVPPWDYTYTYPTAPWAAGLGLNVELYVAITDRFSVGAGALAGGSVGSRFAWSFGGTLIPASFRLTSRHRLALALTFAVRPMPHRFEEPSFYSRKIYLELPPENEGAFTLTTLHAGVVYELQF